MKSGSLLFFLIFLSVITFAQGIYSEYYIDGIAYDKNKQVLKNAEIKVTIGSVIKTIMTDEKGRFEITVPWVGHPGQNDSKNSNPEFIFVEHGDEKLKLDNNWKKYESRSYSKRKSTEKQNLYFN